MGRAAESLMGKHERVPHRATPDKPSPGVEIGGTRTQQTRAPAARQRWGDVQGEGQSKTPSVTGNQSSSCGWLHHLKTPLSFVITMIRQYKFSWLYTIIHLNHSHLILKTNSAPYFIAFLIHNEICLEC